jgi:hypothetical protein
MALLREGTIKRLHVSQPNIRHNRSHGTTLPVITVQTSAGPIHARKASILGESEIVYEPDKPLSCGARVWVQTTAEVVLEGAEMPR